MFDTAFRDASDAAVVEAVAEWQAAESAAAARRLAAIAELARRRCAADEQPEWACDGWDGAAAEVAAALGVSHSRASGQMDLGLTLRHRLPRIAALLWEGKVSVRVAGVIAWRTALVNDSEALALIDATVAGHACGFETLSAHKLDQALDVIIDLHDPGAVRRARASVRSRDVTIDASDHESGTAAFWGRLLATDAALLQRRLDEMAHSVCDEDPRTMGMRRADALGVLAAGATKLSCQCRGPVCPAAGVDPRGAAITITVIAEPSAVTAAQCRAPQDSDAAPRGGAVLIGGGAIPTPLLAELLRLGATVRPLTVPAIESEPGYRPSRALDRFIRARDMTCRFPGCSVPAERCDIDHAVPWPIGPTHPSNLRCLCRKHHLLRTFRGGEQGWTDVQHPDGTVVWTAPTGREHTTRPASACLFPNWQTTTGLLNLPPCPAPTARRGVMMPRRRRTRAQDRAARIRRERALNDTHVAERNRPPPF